MDGSEKIVVFGIDDRSLRIKISNYLDDRYSILGVSDFCSGNDYLQNERFVDVLNLKNESFEYVITCFSDNKRRGQAVYELIKCGISREKIVQPLLLLSEEAQNAPDLVAELANADSDADTVILGLSYSWRGLDHGILKECVDLSWHGQDLYYNVQMYNRVIKNIKPRNVLMVFPYYYFNYDMSRSLYQFVSHQIFANRSFNDWHNAYDSSNDNLKDYMKCIDLFGERFWRNTRWRKENSIDYFVADETRLELPDIWKNHYSETFAENTNTFKKFINSIIDRGCNPIVVTPPILLDKIVDSDRKYYFSMKEEFISVMSEYSDKVQFYDCSELIRDHSFFVDYQHLNELGRKAFTDAIMHLLE